MQCLYICYLYLRIEFIYQTFSVIKLPLNQNLFRYHRRKLLKVLGKNNNLFLYSVSYLWEIYIANVKAAEGRIELNLGH